MAWKWTKKRQEAAVAFAKGDTVKEVADESGVSERTLYYWRGHVDFSEEVDRLTLLTGIATKAERARIAKRVVRNKTSHGMPHTEKDLLDWLKYMNQETEGIVLTLLSSIGGGDDD